MRSQSEYSPRPSPLPRSTARKKVWNVTSKRVRGQSRQEEAVLTGDTKLLESRERDFLKGIEKSTHQESVQTGAEGSDKLGAEAHFASTSLRNTGRQSRAATNDRSSRQLINHTVTEWFTGSENTVFSISGDAKRNVLACHAHSDITQRMLYWWETEEVHQTPKNVPR